MQNAQDQRGFALPMAIFVLTTLGLVSGAGFLVSWMELRAVGSHTAGTRAYYAAEAGLATTLGPAGRPPPARVIALTDGSASVRSSPLLDVDGHGALLLVESTGTITERGTRVSRTVSRVVWVGSAPRFDAALSVDVAATPGSVGTAGATGYITGFPAGCTLPPGAAIATAGPVATGALALAGTPPILVPGPLATTAARTGLRWADLRSGAVPPPDAIVPGDPWPSSGTRWPYVRLQAPGPLGPGHSGQGVIASDGDLHLANGFAWRGLVLVGGSLRIFGDVDLRGAVFVGLDPVLPASIDLGSGLVMLEFDPCAAELAARRLEPYPASQPGTWRETW